MQCKITNEKMFNLCPVFRGKVNESVLKNRCNAGKMKTPTQKIATQVILTG